MSSLILEQTKIKNIFAHNNADKLEIAQVYDWFVVVRKGQYKVDDDVIYIPVDSVLSNELENKIFGPDSKIKLTKGRIRSIKLRGAISQGMLIDPKEFDLAYVKDNVTKYEAPEELMPTKLRGAQPKKQQLNDDFRKYTDIENYKFYGDIFQEGEPVSITLKMHGTSARFGMLKPTNVTLWKRIKKFFGLMGSHEFCYGSRNMQLSDGRDFSFTHEEQGVDMDNVYKYVAKKYKLHEIIPRDLGVYGEIVGAGVQKNYHYNVTKGDYELYIYDIYDFEKKEWLSHEDFITTFAFLQYACTLRTDGKVVLKCVPELYTGPYTKDIVETLRNGEDPIQGGITREGVVIKPLVERVQHGLGRVVLKAISDEYYLAKQTDFH